LLIPLGEAMTAETFKPTTWADATQTRHERKDVITPEPALEVDDRPSFDVAEATPPANVTRLQRPGERTFYEGRRHDRSQTPAARNPFLYKPRDG
jgi:hypothetical protein